VSSSPSRRLSDLGASLWGSIADHAFELKVLREAGIVAPMRPDKALKVGATFLRWGASPATGATTAAIHHPHETSIVDERGSLTFEQVHRRSNALARAFAQMGIGCGDGVGIMCRNHRGFIEATLAAAKLGASALYLNTAFAGPQLAEVTSREAPKALVYDEEFAGMLEGVDPSIARVVAWSEAPQDPAAGSARQGSTSTGSASQGSVEESSTSQGSVEEGSASQGSAGELTLDRLIASASEEDLAPPPEKPRFVILTSGTTGAPKGAQRSSPDGLFSLAALIDKIPFRRRETMVVAAPLFHSWGFFHFILSLPTVSTLVLRRRFDPEDTLLAVQEHRAQVLAAVPVMVQRILALPEETVRRYDLSSLRITSLSGSALPGELATTWMNRFGDNVYNLYGSTEVAYATVATPQDLRAAPGTAGRPPRGTVVRLYDEHGRGVPQGAVGRIFAGNEMSFDGYTGGGGKETIDGLLSTGDVGRFDEAGRLFVEGRDDEMIVSGGENVFPREVEDLLADHADIAEAAVIGVDDAEFGQRLKAFVVAVNGKALSEKDVKEYVKHNLARYKVPREVCFLPELPRNATGKVLKRELRRAS
jgi:acyl-CoA synthetase (AMP-forming)/AMP-acid ligase II